MTPEQIREARLAAEKAEEESLKDDWAWLIQAASHLDSLIRNAKKRKKRS